MDSLVQPCYSQLLPGCLRLPSMFSQGHTATLHLPNEGIVNLVSNVLRKHDSNRPYALPRFWKSHIDIEIIQSKFVWICYPPIQSRLLAENLRRKRRNNWICTFESSRKSICFRNQVSGLLRKLESSHVSLRDEKILETSLAKFKKILVTHDRDEK